MSLHDEESKKEPLSTSNFRNTLSEKIIKQKEELNGEDMKKDKLIEFEKKNYWNKSSYYLISFYAGVSSITELAVSYYFKDVLQIGPSMMSQLMSLIVLPWSLKPFLGLLTDLRPILGYKRKGYIIICGIIATICWLLMAFLNPTILATCLVLFFVNVCNAFSSVLGEAIVVELAKSNAIIKEDSEEEGKTNAKEYVSLFMIFKYFGVLMASFLKGALVENFGITFVFYLGSSLPALVTLAGVIMIDTKISNPESKEKITEKLRISETGGPSEESLILAPRGQNIRENNSTSIHELLEFIFQRKIIVPLLFIVIFMATPSYTDPFFYYLTEKLGFTATSLGQISFCSTCGVLLGIFSYKTYFKTVELRNILIICTLLSFIFTFSANILVLRININLGISDFLMVLLSNSLLTMLGEVMLLPLLSLACVLCPKNMEGTIFSVFMSALNFGSVLSNLIGSIITNYLGITSKNFDHLHDLIMISNIASLLPLFLLLCINNEYFKH